MTHDGGSDGQIDLGEVFPTVPFKGGGEEACVLCIATEAAISGIVGVQNDSISPALLDSDAVVSETLSGVEVENPQQAGAFENNDFVRLVLQADVGLRAVQPSILLFRPLHFGIEVVEEFVPQQIVVGEVELAARIPKAVVVARSWEIEPFRMAEFITLKVEVALAAEPVRD